MSTTTVADAAERSTRGRRRHPGPNTSGPPRPRQCGRCRRFFPGESSPELSDALIWWACPPCRTKLFPHPNPNRTSNTAAAHECRTDLLRRLHRHPDDYAATVALRRLDADPTLTGPPTTTRPRAS